MSHPQNQNLTNQPNTTLHHLHHKNTTKLSSSKPQLHQPQLYQFFHKSNKTPRKPSSTFWLKDPKTHHKSLSQLQLQPLHPNQKYTLFVTRPKKVPEVMPTQVSTVVAQVVSAVAAQVVSAAVVSTVDSVVLIRLLVSDLISVHMAAAVAFLLLTVLQVAPARCRPATVPQVPADLRPATVPPAEALTKSCLE